MKGKQHKQGRNPKDQNIENGGSGTVHTWKMNGKREQQGQRKNSYVSSFNVSRECNTFGIRTVGGKTHLACLYKCLSKAKLRMSFYFVEKCSISPACSKSDTETIEHRMPKGMEGKLQEKRRK
jgi:hypothetical protein